MPRPLVLVSDDQPLVTQVLARHLIRLGCDVLTDSDSQVLALARRHRPDVVVLDVCQRVDGRELVRQLRADPELARTKVVMMSGVDGVEWDRLCARLDADDFEQKPWRSVFPTRLARLAGAYC